MDHGAPGATLQVPAISRMTGFFPDRKEEVVSSRDERNPVHINLFSLLTGTSHPKKALYRSAIRCHVGRFVWHPAFSTTKEAVTLPIRQHSSGVCPLA